MLQMTRFSVNVLIIHCVQPIADECEWVFFILREEQEEGKESLNRGP